MIGAGWRGAGYEIGDDAVAAMRADAAAGFVDIVARLLAATFTARATEGAALSARGSLADRAKRRSPSLGTQAMEAGLGR